jgi:hypothetical protein
MQQVIGINIDRQVNVHPALHLLCRFVILGHQHIFFINPDHATGLDQAPPLRRAATGNNS